MLQKKHILIGITGSIAAYKSALLVRLFVKAGVDVKVIMTDSAKDFISPLTLSTLSKNKVYSEVSDGDQWNNHVELGLWADVMIIAPCTANTLSKMATGLTDNMLMASYLSAKCPVFIAPAMDLDMYIHPSTIHNLKTVTQYGNHVIPASHGELASGLVGEGRMAEPEDIVAFIEEWFMKTMDLKGKNILITAGPTVEAIDPVRYISNHSSGKMGINIADECADRGAEVTLVLGPSSLKPIHTGIKIIHTVTAEDMYNACKKAANDADVMIFAAAVADYKPLTIASEKIKKSTDTMTIPLTKTKDIALELSTNKRNDQISVGFALETTNQIEYAQGKLKKKNLDMIVLNSPKDKGAGFKHDTNKISIIHQDNKILHYELKSKKEVAKDIIDVIVQKLNNQSGS